MTFEWNLTNARILDAKAQKSLKALQERGCKYEECKVHHQLNHIHTLDLVIDNLYLCMRATIFPQEFVDVQVWHVVVIGGFGCIPRRGCVCCDF